MSIGKVAGKANQAGGRRWGRLLALVSVMLCGSHPAIAQGITTVRAGERAIVDANEREVLKLGRQGRLIATLQSSALALDAKERAGLESRLNRLDRVSSEALDTRLPLSDRQQSALLIADLIGPLEASLKNGSVDIHDLSQQMTGAPQLFGLYSDLSFVLGIRGAFAHDSESRYDVELETNIVGAVLGQGLGSIGSEGLKKFITDNLSTSVALPLQSGGKIQPVVGVGLGRRDIAGWSLWPVLEMTQSDSNDVLIPRGVARGASAEERWSSPSLSLAMPFWIGAHRNEARKSGELPHLVASLSVTLPYYYPGDPYAALSALFTNSAKKFVRSGGERYRIGLHLPLNVIKRAPASTGLQ